MKELIVENNDNIRLDSYIANENSDLSRAVIQKLLEDGNILVNDVIKKSSYKVKKGDVIKIEIPEPKESKIEAQDIPIEIVYEDNDIIVVNKPKGLVVHPANGNEDGTLVNAIMNICKEYNIGINTFIKEIIGNKKNPELTRKVFNISDGKIYLGKQKQISNELIEKIYLTKDKTIEKLAIVIAQMYGRLNNFEDLKQEVYLKLIENGGKIETNLSYDQNLVINVLMKGIKYAMFNYLSKNKFEISLIQQTADGYFDLLDVIEDNTYNPQDVFENSNTDTLLSSEDITDQHREFYEVLKRYSDILIDNREKGLEKIAQIFDISVETVMQKMIELQTIAINSQLVKFDSKGRVLLNEVI